jgi:hypothetical protein
MVGRLMSKDLFFIKRAEDDDPIRREENRAIVEESRENNELSTFVQENLGESWREELQRSNPTTYNEWVEQYNARRRGPEGGFTEPTAPAEVEGGRDYSSPRYGEDARNAIHDATYRLMYDKLHLLEEKLDKWEQDKIIKIRLMYATAIVVAFGVGAAVFRLIVVSAS